MDVNLVCWNMQGAGTKYAPRDKWDVVLNWFSHNVSLDDNGPPKYTVDVALIQECGMLQDIKPYLTVDKGYNYIEMPGSSNFVNKQTDIEIRVVSWGIATTDSRCNMAIVARGRIRGFDILKNSGNSRPLIYFKTPENLTIACLHAKAVTNSKDGGDFIDQILREIDKADVTADSAPFKHGFCIGGDFNCDPLNFEKLVSKRSLNKQGVRVYAPKGYASHKSGKTLDFFVSDQDGSSPSVIPKAEGMSDHYPIYFTCSSATNRKRGSGG